MTDLNLDDPLKFRIIPLWIKGVSMGDITKTIVEKAAYIEVTDRLSYDDEDSLKFYFLTSDNDYVSVSDSDDRRLSGRLPGRCVEEPYSEETVIYRLMQTLDLAGEIEDISGDEWGISVWVSFFPSLSDIYGGTP